MSARAKLNAVYGLGAMVGAAAVGGAAGSWGVFWATLAALFVLSVCTGSIRPVPRARD